MALSSRGKSLATMAPTMTLWQVVKDLYDPNTNPDGILSLGIAENALMHEKLATYIEANVRLPQTALTYGEGGAGTTRIRETVGRFLTERFKAVSSVTPDQVAMTNGVSTGIEHLSMFVADPGDAFLLGRPYYGAFPDDIELRTGVECVPVSFNDTDPLGEDAVAVYEAAIQSCQAKKQRVAALMLCNPHNPLGRCYSRSTIIALMRLCNKYSIHFVSDEIYGLTVWRDQSQAEPDEPTLEPFTSALSIDLTDIIDPALVHVLWGLSKDFGANGLRVGTIISQHNKVLHQAMVPVMIYSYASSLVENIAATLLEDDAFVDSYVAENNAKLYENYKTVVTWAQKYGIIYEKGANAAFFLWLDLGKFYLSAQNDVSGSGTTQSCSDVSQVVTDALLREKVFLASGANFGSERGGWFRIVFSQNKDILEEGLRRIVAALKRNTTQVAVR